MSIHGMQKHLSELVPEARVAVAHGQMHEKELASIMHDFVRGEFDVLLCTTIIESGVDIPNYASNECWLPHNTAYLNALMNLRVAK